MSEPGATIAWFHFIGTNRVLEDEIRAKLSKEGVHLAPADKPSPARHGILCFPEIGDELLGFLHQIRGPTRGHVLALAATASALQPAGSWRLLHAGASEVLVWDERNNATSQVKAKLERWTAVDELADLAQSRVALVGDSEASLALVRGIAEAARFSDAPILLIGESGTGKELLARLVHLLDVRRTGQRDCPDLVTVDCSTVVPELSGSELFGHERGAFTGAVISREGAFALADGGTLFLDEVGELPLNLQRQLLRAIQEKIYKRIGGNVWQGSDFRLVCATNRDLAELVSQSQFRLDLYHRIAGWVFRTLPLQERREDILPLARHFLNTAHPRQELLEFDEAVSEYLLNRIYPGNVRELRQLVQRIAHRHVGPGPVTIGDIPEDDRPAGPGLQRAWPDATFEKSIANAVALGAGLKEITQVTSETAIRIAVQSEKGNLQRAARRLGITDRALQMRRASGRIPS